MKRTTTALSAFAAGAALLLAGCGSDTSGAPASQAPATSQLANTSTSAAASTDESTSEEATSEESTTDESTTEESTTDESTGEESSTADTSATTTVGNGGDLDETSVTWFDTYCSGVAPALTEVKKLSTVMSGGSSSDPQATLKKLAPIFSAMGNAFTKTAKDLDGVPVPTFDGGDTLADTTLKAMNEFGPKFTEIGTALAKGDTSALADMGKDVQGLQELNRFEVDAGTLTAIKAIPSCEPLFSMGG